MRKLPETVTVIGAGLFQPLAHVLARHFERVLYYRPIDKEFPKPNDTVIGTGYDDIGRIDVLFDESVIAETDLFVFPDIHWALEQKYLRSIGKLVFGSGDADALELWRHDFYKELEDAGLPTVPHEMIKGMKALREHLQKVEDKYIKVSLVRGLMETWHHTEYRLTKPKLDEIEYDLGCLSEEQEFMVQDALESEREVGSDQIIVDGRFPKTVQYSVEGKDKTCLAMMRATAALPKEVRFVNDRIGDLLKPVRGFFSSEIRIGKKDKLPYFTDPTVRHASPAGETYLAMCGNIGEMILGAAQGVIVEPQCPNRFAAQALLVSEQAETMNVPIYIDPKVRDMVFLYHSGIRESDGQECVMKTDAKFAEIGSVVGVGKTIDEAIMACKKNAEGVEAYGLQCYTDKLDEFKKDLMP
jgi:hypothetical protein